MNGVRPRVDNVTSVSAWIACRKGTAAVPESPLLTRVYAKKPVIRESASTCTGDLLRRYPPVSCRATTIPVYLAASKRAGEFVPGVPLSHAHVGEIVRLSFREVGEQSEYSSDRGAERSFRYFTRSDASDIGFQQTF